MTLEAIGIVVALAAAAFCSGTLSALAALDEGAGEISEDDEEDESTKASETLAWWRPRRRAVGLVLAFGHRIGIAAAVVLSVIVVGTFVQMTPATTVGVVAAVALVVVAICDVVPQTLGRNWPHKTGIRALRGLRLPYLVLYPVVRLLLALRNTVASAVGLEDCERSDEERAEDRRVLKHLSDGSVSSSDRRRWIRSVVEFPATTVREVMIPRTDMVTLSMDMELDEILTILLECGHSRIPVHGQTLDDIEGLFYAKDLIELMASGRDFEIEDFLREPYFVPETKPISELLTEFQQERIHLAVVVDEFGGTEGLITLEDIIEEIFGDIQDEYDVEESQLVELSSDTVMADARIGIDEIEDHFDVELPDNGEYDSLGGFLLDQTGGVPEAGEQLEWDSLVFRVVEADAKRVDTVEIQRSESPEAPTELVS